MDRRRFVQAAGAAALGGSGWLRAQSAAGAEAGAWTGPIPATAPWRQFEVEAALYAWDLHDEGVERVLDNVQGMAGVNSVYLIGLMHPERRPEATGTYPHNPVRKFWMAEDARANWRFDPKRYGRIKPRPSDYAWLADTDWTRVFVDAARRRGLRVGFEFSHSLVDKQRVEGEFADLANRNLQGEITHVRDWLRPVCPNQPDVREYAVAAFTEVIEKYDVDWVESAIVLMDEAAGGSPARGGGCFCAACRKAAPEFGVDLEKVQAVLRKDPAAQPELGQWQQFRYASVVAFYKELHAAVHKAKPGIVLRYNMHAKNPRDFGVDIVQLRPQLDALRIQDYSEQSGQMAAMSGKRTWLTEERGNMGPEFNVVSGVALRPRATPELVREGVKIAVETKMNGIMLGFYDGGDFANLRAVRAGLVDAGLPVSRA
ncbi:MAG TPA: hypothetical protein VG714_06625 [Acidobacteriaceae bacterium]|nr:hypothetical protein [Acidobacteriaceae bacterium]